MSREISIQQRQISGFGDFLNKSHDLFVLLLCLHHLLHDSAAFCNVRNQKAAEHFVICSFRKLYCIQYRSMLFEVRLPRDDFSAFSALILVQGAVSVRTLPPQPVQYRPGFLHEAPKHTPPKGRSGSHRCGCQSSLP